MKKKNNIVVSFDFQEGNFFCEMVCFSWIFEGASIPLRGQFNRSIKKRGVFFESLPWITIIWLFITFLLDCFTRQWGPKFYFRKKKNKLERG